MSDFDDDNESGFDSVNDDVVEAAWKQSCKRCERIESQDSKFCVPN